MEGNERKDRPEEEMKKKLQEQRLEWKEPLEEPTREQEEPPRETTHEQAPRNKKMSPHVAKWQ
jgi:hypothetical protein